jgi:hypothetical protein
MSSLAFRTSYSVRCGSIGGPVVVGGVPWGAAFEFAEFGGEEEDEVGGAGGDGEGRLFDSKSLTASLV